MGRIFGSITETIGRTPLVDIGPLNDTGATILAKLEFFNPGGSVKDRIGLSMIEAGEREGRISARSVLGEATSGNTGL